MGELHIRGTTLQTVEVGRVDLGVMPWRDAA
jgi:hypothetical protein